MHRYHLVRDETLTASTAMGNIGRAVNEFGPKEERLNFL